MGHLCGYVGVPANHPLHGKSYDEARDAIPELEVHGGLTYAEACQGPICHVPAEGEDESLWWFGFDCAHCWDISPQSLKYGVDLGFDSRYRSIDYVKRETERLAARLYELSGTE